MAPRKFIAPRLPVDAWPEVVARQSGLHHIKGFAEPVRAWRVVAETPAGNRFDARHAAGMTPLVGRERELTLLTDCWRQAKEGEGQVVLLSGEPGIGKSRILHTLRSRLDENTYLSLRYSCSPYHQTTPLYPFIEQLEQAADIARNDASEQKLDKVRSLLAQGATGSEDEIPLIAALLSISTDEQYLPLRMSPQHQKEKTFKTLVAQLYGLAAHQPVLILFEDAHWIDPTSLELLDLTVDRIQNLPVLLIITFRPEFSPPWTGHAHVTALRLNRLSRRLSTAMIERVTGGKTLPSTMVDQILLRTDGVPLFVEELTKAVLESGLLTDKGDYYSLSGPLTSLAVPSTLQDSLMARLGRLAPVKEVAQIGAVIGRRFSFELISALAPLPDSVLREALNQLAEAELVFHRGVPPEATYTFKHALIQDAAYGTLLRGKRQQLHARVAEVLEDRFPETVKMEPELFGLM